jgi:hypothetical protein
MSWWRAFTLDHDGALISPDAVMRSATQLSPWTDARFEQAAATARPCPKYDHPSPAAGCKCGLYVWQRAQVGTWMCMRSSAPRIVAELEVTAPIEPSDGHCPLYPTSSSWRVRALRMTRLLVLGPRHCVLCQAQADQAPRVDTGVVAALRARYGVPVEGLGWNR